MRYAPKGLCGCSCRAIPANSTVFMRRHRQSAEQSRVQNGVWSIVLIALILHLFAWCLPALGDSSDQTPGIVALLLGWLYLLAMLSVGSIFGLPWLANP